MYTSESATAVAATAAITILTTLSTAFSIQRLCAHGSRDQAQSAGMLHREPHPVYPRSPQAAGGPELGGSRAFSRCGAGAQIQGGIECGLWGRITSLRGRCAEGIRHRQQ